ncbi:hypothetical protein [Kordia sp.]|uniref:hypothetical protein n=1 Tax=Kordia sp. TaxID=1965332 RepID=UPI003B5A1645
MSDYKKELRKRVSEFILSNDIGKIEEEQLIFFNEPIKNRIAELSESYKTGTEDERKKLLNKFKVSGVIRKAITNDPELKKAGAIQPYFSKTRDITNFVFFDVEPKLGKIDSFALLLGYDGFEEFSKKLDEENKELALSCTSNITSLSSMNPMENAALSSFFENPCYLYVYDEDLAKVNKETDPLKYHFPNIDALVLEYDKEQHEFTLRNTSNAKHRKKEDHFHGKIHWCKESQNAKDDCNAFDIIFEKSRTKLILRFHLPYERMTDDIEFDLILGAFLISMKKGNVAIGTIVLHRNIEGKPLTPYKFDFSKEQSSDETPPEAIQKYLFDRYKNWIKIPYDQWNLDDFSLWLEKKHGKNYTATRIITYDYLITHPNSALDRNDWNKLNRLIKLFFENPTKAIENSTGLTENQKKYLGEFIALKYQNNRFVQYPNSEKERKHHERINRDFIRELIQSLNVIIIIPKGNYERISSIYTIIGYSIALKKRTLVFFEKGVERPNILKEPEKKVNLYVYDYENLFEIPEILVRNKFRDTWRQRAATYLKIDPSLIDPM